MDERTAVENRNPKLSHLQFILRSYWRNGFIVVALIVDIVAMGISGVSAYIVRSFLPNVTKFSPDVFYFFTIYFTTVLIFFGLVLGVYRAAYHSNQRQQYFIAGKAYIYSMMVIFASFYLLQLVEVPRRFTILFFIVLPLFYILGRVLLNSFNMYMQSKGYGIHNALIAGYEKDSLKIFSRFKGFPELGYDIKGIVSKHKNGSAEKIITFPEHDLSFPEYSLAQLNDVVRLHRVDKIFVPSPKFATNGFSELVEVCKRENIELKILSPEADRLLEMARVYDVAGITLFSEPRPRTEKIRSVVKRCIDFISSLLLICILSPVFICTSLAIVIESGAPVFFRHKRASTRGGKEFDFFKFRSMVHNADELKESLMQFNEADGALFKMKNDPRMTSVGKFIRKFSIDELPQLFNVLKGDMSLVGPRPLPIGDFEKLGEDQEFWEALRIRDKVKPGITGLWQISGRSNIGFREMVLLDLYYIENQSLIFDLEIMFETIPVVVFGRGSY
jgi:exopolysaccharide biosynthesis polyprenyl glycosylphosphotransferase